MSGAGDVDARDVRYSSRARPAARVDHAVAGRRDDERARGDARAREGQVHEGVPTAWQKDSVSAGVDEPSTGSARRGPGRRRVDGRLGRRRPPEHRHAPHVREDGRQ